MSVPTDSGYDALLPWMERHLGGRVVACNRQGDRRSGGRPAFFIDVERPDGELVRTYARMSRGQGQLEEFSLGREHAVLEELHAAGIAVPQPLGHCPEPEGILLERLAGEDDYSLIRDEAQRDAIDRAFVAEIAKVHALDIAPFEARGLVAPKSREEFVLNDLAHWEHAFDLGARQPVPLVRFARNWLHRNIPDAPERAALIQGDTGPGQFMFEGNQLTGIVDWEFAHLADPMLDLAQIRARDWYNPGADLKKWLAYYSEFSGTPVDLPRLRYYYVKAMIITPLALAGIVQRMHPLTDHAEWYAQDISYKRGVVEAQAEAMGIELRPVELPEPTPSLRAPIFELVETNLRDEFPDATGDDFARYRIGLARRLATYARNIERFGAAFEAQELDEMGEILGARPGSVIEGNEALEAYVQAQRLGDADEEALVHFFYRHAIRENALMAGALGAGDEAVHQSVV